MDRPPFRQRVPRPSSARPGPPPPWTTLSPGSRSSVAIGRLIATVAAATARATPVGVTAAVLVPVFASGAGAELTIVLIRRASHLQRDPGHIAFPGGRVEPGEAPEAAALREAEEEIGLARSDVEVRGLLDVVARRSDERIAAYLGLLGRPPILAPNASEVDSVLEVPAAALLADGVAWQERWGWGPQERSVKFFAHPVALGDDLIWGVSAQILWRVLEQVTGSRVPAPGASPVVSESAGPL